MPEIVNHQVLVFLFCIIGGAIVGLVFDLFRISRKIFKTNDFITSVEDILFWVLVGAIVLYTVFLANNGELRGYIFLGIGLGTILYFMIFSSIIIKASMHILLFIKKVIHILIKFFEKPVKMMLKITIFPAKKLIQILDRQILLIKKLVTERIKEFQRYKKIIKEKA